jgi:hypothetical protein
MSCINCPYNELEARHNRGNYQDDYAWCDKVGGKHYGYGWCDEIYEIKPYQTKKSYKKKEKFNKYYRNKKYKDKLKKLCNRQSSNCLYSSYYPVIWKTIQYNYSTTCNSMFRKLNKSRVKNITFLQFFFLPSYSNNLS